MSRKGHYPGANTSIGLRDASWFTKESTQVPRDESAPKPERSPKEHPIEEGEESKLSFGEQLFNQSLLKH